LYITYYAKIKKILYERVNVDAIRFYRNIRPVYNRSLIYTRLGYAKTNTFLEPERKRQIDKWITEAENLCGVDVIFRLVEISVEADVIFLDGSERLVSSSLAALLGNSGEAVLMASTSGFRITEEIERLQEAGEMARALVYDAAASEITDAGLDWLMGLLRQKLIREGRALTHMRYSPGYGDLTFYSQEILYRLLNLKEWGIELTEKCMLVPEKTVIAIAGIESYWN